MATPHGDLRRANFGRRLVYLGVALCVIVPFIKPLALPLVPSKWSKELYDRVDKLPKGKVILLSLDYDPAAQAELYPMSKALLEHSFKKGLRPIVMCHWVNGVGLAKTLLEEAAAKHGLESGRDFVFLGFKPGYSNLVLNMGESLQGAFERDYYGKPTAGMPALEGVKSLKDVPMVIDIAAGATVEMWIAYGRDRFGFELGAGCTGVIAPDLYPFLNSKQLVGFLGGLRGAADYEFMVGAPGEAVKGMDAQSLTHLLIIGLIIGANTWYVLRRSRGKAET